MYCILKVSSNLNIILHNNNMWLSNIKCYNCYDTGLKKLWLNNADSPVEKFLWFLLNDIHIAESSVDSLL